MAAEKTTTVNLTQNQLLLISHALDMYGDAVVGAGSTRVYDDADEEAEAVMMLESIIDQRIE